MKKIVTLSLLIASVACVTINVYFPAVAAEKAADRIIDNVWGKENAAKPAAEPPAAGEPVSLQETAARWMAQAIGSVVSTAHANEANIDVSSPAIKAVTSAMEARHASLVAHYASGAIGLTQNGEVALRDASLVPLKDRNAIRQLIADENTDRRNLYREIAAANGHPEWETEIRNTFAKRWISKAKSGWYYQDAGGAWVQK